MLQHLDNLSRSVSGLCPIYHPWVRHMGSQDRWIISLTGDGTPASVTLVPAVDAKLFVTIAKDNHNCFPAFKGRSLPLRFTQELLHICSEGPMYQLLRSVTNIRTAQSWWARVDDLIQRAPVDDKYKDIDTFALDVVQNGSSAIEPSMRSCISDALFAWEAKTGAGEYETDTAPRPKLGILGLCYLFSRNPDIPSFTRYGMTGLRSYPVHKQMARQMSASLEWITQDQRRGKTWQAVPGKDKTTDDLLIIHVSGDPEVQARLADFFGDVQGSHDSREANYSALAESVTKFFSNEKVANSAQNRVLDLLLLRRISLGVTRVETHLQLTVPEVKRVISEWQAALDNVPFSPFTLRYMPPGEVTNTLQRRWVGSGERYLNARWELSSVYDVMFYRSSARRMVEQAYLNGKSLLLSSSRSNYKAGHLSVLGLSLWYAGRTKELIVESIAFKLGRFLQLVDLLHEKYCEKARDGSLPPQLLGNAHFEVMSLSPAKGLAMIQSRLKLYQGFAQTRGDGLARWALAQIGTLSTEIASQLPVSLATEDKAQMLLGYLARTPSNQPKPERSAEDVSVGTPVA